MSAEMSLKQKEKDKERNAEDKGEIFLILFFSLFY